MKKILSLIGLSILLSTAASYAVEDDKKDWTLDLKTSTLIPKYIGKVKIIRGKVMGGDNELAKGDKIFPKSKIITSEKSFVVFEMVDETVLTLGPASEFIMEEWDFRTKADREGTLSLIKGAMRAEIKMKTKEDDQLKIKSPLVAMGIRGTEVLLNNIQVKGKWLTQAALIEGKVILVNKATNKETPLSKNDYVEVVEGSSTAEVTKKLTEDEIKKYNTVVAPNEKLLLDYPAVVMNEVVTDPNEKGADAAFLVKSSAEAGLVEKRESASWRENLEKLNDLRKKKD